MKYHCQKCGYKWTPRTENPKECPNCKSRSWQKVITVKVQIDAKGKLDVATWRRDGTVELK